MPLAFEQEVNDLRERSRAKGMQDKLVLFYGSSSFTLWSDIEQHFPEYILAKHGFGGSTLEDCVTHFDRLVADFDPRAIVLYAGDNDLADGATPERVLASLDALIARKRQTIGAVPTAYVSIKISPARFHIMHRIGYTNLIIERRLQGEPDVRFVDITRRMTGRGLIAFLDYYASDPLHMNRDGYRVLGKSVSEYLTMLAEAGDDLRHPTTVEARGVPAWAADDSLACGSSATNH